MLVQIDASPHEWIIGGELFTLHGAIDDATGEILALFFTPNECMEGYFEIIRQIVKNYGIPMSLYCDRHTIFVSPNDGKLSIEDQLKGKTVNLTQFGRAMEELGITIIKANSPQAKGRIEKLWDTLQSRLPVEFKIRGIDTMEAYMPFYRSLLLLTMKNLVLNLKILNLPLDLLILVLSLIIFYALRKNVLSLKILLSLTKESIINL
jgi:hypothetical protein